MTNTQQPQKITQVDNAEFIESLKKQDHDAMRVLVSEYHALLQTVARSIVGESIAEEVVQESWIAAFKALPKFEGRSTLKTWLFTIVSNHAKSRLRKENRTVSLDSDQNDTDPLEKYAFKDNGHWASPVSDWHIDSPDGLLEERQLKKCIEKTLSLLPDKQKAVFCLRDLEQLSLESICNILTLSESNTRVLLHRARVKLMQVIDHYQETGTC